MFGFFRKAAVGNGAITAMKQLGIGKEDRTLLIEMAYQTGLLESVSVLKIPQRARSVMVCHLILASINRMANEPNAHGDTLRMHMLYREQASIFLEALTAQLKTMTEDERLISAGALSNFYGKIFDDHVSPSDVRLEMEF